MTGSSCWSIPMGQKWWRLEYRTGGREKLISFGVSSQTGLDSERMKRDDARAQLAADVGPSAARKAGTDSDAGRFEAFALEWIAKETPGWAPAQQALPSQTFVLTELTPKK